MSQSLREDRALPHREQHHPPGAGELQHRPTGNWKSHEHRPHEKRRLLASLLLTGTTMVIEAIGGWLSGSLSLLSDAGHMLTHTLALGISYSAIVLADRPVAPHRSFGLYRLEVLAALANGLAMFVVASLIVYEAFERFRQPISIQTGEMFLIALLGLVVNLICALILAPARHGDLNVKSAFLHMLGDTASSVGVVACAIAIYYTGWLAADPLTSIAIALLIFVWGIQLTRDSVNILLETTPRHIDVNEVMALICREIPEVQQLHDIHIWEITSNLYAMTAHALTADLRVSQTHEILERISRLVKDRFGICHANIQFEYHQS